MPYVNVKLNVKESDELREEIVAIILDKTSNVLNKKACLTSILIEFVSNDNWTIGGKNEKTFYLNIKVTKGTNTKEQKEKYSKEIYQEFKALLGEINHISYIVIDEIEADSWGFEGLTQEYRYIKNKII